MRSSPRGRPCKCVQAFIDGSYMGHLWVICWLRFRRQHFQKLPISDTVTILSYFVYEKWMWFSTSYKKVTQRCLLLPFCDLSEIGFLHIGWLSPPQYSFTRFFRKRLALFTIKKVVFILKENVMRSMKRDYKSTKLILQESEKAEFRSKWTFLGVFFCRNWEKCHSRTYPQNIRVFVFKCE